MNWHKKIKSFLSKRKNAVQYFTLIPSSFSLLLSVTLVQFLVVPLSDFMRLFFASGPLALDRLPGRSISGVSSSPHLENDLIRYISGNKMTMVACRKKNKTQRRKHLLGWQWVTVDNKHELHAKKARETTYFILWQCHISLILLYSFQGRKVKLYPLVFKYLKQMIKTADDQNMANIYIRWWATRISKKKRLNLKKLKINFPIINTRYISGRNIIHFLQQK